MELRDHQSSREATASAMPKLPPLSQDRTGRRKYPDDCVTARALPILKGDNGRRSRHTRKLHARYDVKDMSRRSSVEYCPAGEIAGADH
jgi:hypothetical protein